MDFHRISRMSQSPTLRSKGFLFAKAFQLHAPSYISEPESSDDEDDVGVADNKSTPVDVSADMNFTIFDKEYQNGQIDTVNAPRVDAIVGGDIEDEKNDAGHDSDTVEDDVDADDSYDGIPEDEEEPTEEAVKFDLRQMRRLRTYAERMIADPHDIHVDVDRMRMTLQKMYHAATCTAAPSDCADAPYCRAYKKLYGHAVSCSSECRFCPVPGCRKTQLVWAHYRQCAEDACFVCSAAPKRYADLGVCRVIDASDTL